MGSGTVAIFAGELSSAVVKADRATIHNRSDGQDPYAVRFRQRNSGESASRNQRQRPEDLLDANLRLRMQVL